jgi:hypothetical protein
MNNNNKKTRTATKETEEAILYANFSRELFNK